MSISASRAVRITITASGNRLRSARHTSTPSISGRPRSSTTRSGAAAPAVEMAEVPSRNQLTAYLAPSNAATSACPIASSSSTRSTLPIAPSAIGNGTGPSPGAHMAISCPTS